MYKYIVIAMLAFVSFEANANDYESLKRYAYELEATCKSLTKADMTEYNMWDKCEDFIEKPTRFCDIFGTCGRTNVSRSKTTRSSGGCRFDSDIARDGSRCGKRSAKSRPGGRDPWFKWW